MKLFITGASGFVGGAVVHEALKRGYEVIAMSRSDRSDEKIRALGATPVRCSLDNVSSKHLDGCDAVIHSAAFVGEWGSREDFWKANVSGTENMLKAAKEAGVNRFIHIGTEAVLFRGQPMRNVDETYPYPKSTPFLYSETKREAEKRVIDANVKGFETVSIRPRLIWGPGDQSVLPTLMLAIRAGRFVWIDNGRALTSIVHINNLCHAIFLALETGKNIGGEIFFVTDDEDWTVKEFFSRLFGTQGIKLSFPSIPGWMVRAMAIGAEYHYRILGKKSSPFITRFGANLMSRECTINISKIKREMGYQPVIDVETGLKQMPRLRRQGRF